ncbi:phosphatidylinositol kinase [Aureococcus anophagefferens]|nr:phosphatidylinositol kinase [Aureococcus anophagefferens]
MEGSLVKNNTTGGAEYSRKVFCVLMGYTLWEFDTEADARAGLWPRAEADVIGVALTLGVELLLLTGLAEGAGGAATCVPHEPPQPDASASHCAASGAAFGYTVARHTCAASGRAFAAAHMAPAPLPLPGIGLGHAAKLSDACAQAQQLLNASRCRARLLAAAAHGADLEQTLERKFKADRKPLWLLHKDQLDAPPPAPLLSLDGSAPPPPPANTRDEAAKAACGILLSDAPLSDPEYLALFNTCREAARDAADRSYDAYVAQVLDGMRGDTAALVGELHALTTFPPPPGGRGAPLPPRPRAASAEPAKKEEPKEELVDQSRRRRRRVKGEEKDDADAVVVQIDDGDAAFARDQDVLRSRLPSSSHGVAVRDVLVALLHVRADDDDLVPLDEEPPPPAQLQTPRPGPVKRTRKGPNLLFYLPQLAHVYYRCLPPRDADAAVRVTLVEEFLLKTSRRSFRFALRLAWMLVAYLEDRGAAPARRPHVLRLVELEARARVLLPRVPPWLALELRRASSALRRAVAKALATLGVAPAEPVVDLSAPESPGGKAKQYFETDRLGSSSDYDVPPCVPPDDVLAREMRFVRAMCDVAEAMRSVEHGNRPARLKKELEALPRRTPLAHSPINATYVVTESGARSLHLGRVARIPPNEGHVFKTKARAPTLMLLETVDDPKAGADLPASAASPSPLVGGSDSDTSDDVVALELLEQTRASERDKELAELLAKQLGDVAPEPEDGEPRRRGAPARRRRRRARDRDAAAARVASATTLSVLAEGETPREGDDDAASQPEKRSVSPVPPPDFGSESGEAFASEPVASGSRDRAEVVRALRKKPALGLKIERLSSITGPGLGGGGSPEAAESEGSNDDLRQEVCALQIIAACNDAFEAAGLGGDETGLWLRHYSIVPTGASTGIIETMADAVSLDGLKKAKEFTTLKHHFHVAHGGDGFGHVIHIDFGFLLGQAPGGSFSLARVSFKLTAEHVDAMGGWSSDGFADFVVLLACGFAALQKHASKILHLVEIMAKDSPFPCFKNGPACVDKMRAKLKLHFTTKEQVAHHVAELVRQSYNAYGTRQYDSFQYLTNGIYS